MPSLVLGVAARSLMALLLVFSIFLLLRGHNEPGGGFVGGLAAGAAFALYALAHGVEAARGVIRVDPRRFLGAGLLVALAAGGLGLAAGRPFLTGLWIETPVPVIGKLGTPILFDTGVYLVVVGMVLTVLFPLLEE
jgi:multicomponent Na+:H+ antiporter subunit B